jgi:transposase
MMGTKAREFATHTAISVEALVPTDHFYRHLEQTLNLAFVRDLVGGYYAAGGRPGIDPVVFFKLQLILFFEGLRSERQLMAAVADRLSLRWYLGYDLGERVPDHSSLTRIRERYGLETFRRFFDAVVERCRAAGLVWGEELYLDATKVEANAARASLVPRFAVEAHLRQLFPAEDAADTGSSGGEDPNRAVADVPAPTPLPVARPATMLEELATANAQRHDWIAEAGAQQRAVRHEKYERKADFVVSTTDPDATFMYRRSGGTHLGYHTHYVVDGGRARIILKALVTPAEVHEPQPALDLIWQTCFRWRLRPRHVTGDTAYGTIENIVALEEAGIRAYVPLPEPDARRRGFAREDFTYDAGRDCYVCPQGAVLARRQAKTERELVIYQAPAATCNACLCKADCTPSDDGRAVQRHAGEAYRDRVRAYHATAAYRKAIRKRAVWVEPLFAEAKLWHRFLRFRLRTLKRVNIEAQLVAAGQNLKRLLTQGGWGRRPWPAGGAGIATASATAAYQCHD